jgi:hypothetical protein
MSAVAGAGRSNATDALAHEHIPAQPGKAYQAPDLVPGLINTTGNSCFFNAIAQALAPLPPMHGYLGDICRISLQLYHAHLVAQSKVYGRDAFPGSDDDVGEKHAVSEPDGHDTTADLARKLLRLLAQLNAPCHSAAGSPAYFKPDMALSEVSSDMDSRDQQDAHELLTHLLALLDDDVYLTRAADEAWDRRSQARMKRSVGCSAAGVGGASEIGGGSCSDDDTLGFGGVTSGAARYASRRPSRDIGVALGSGAATAAVALADGSSQAGSSEGSGSAGAQGSEGTGAISCAPVAAGPNGASAPHAPSVASGGAFSSSAPSSSAIVSGPQAQSQHSAWRGARHEFALGLLAGRRPPAAALGRATSGGGFGAGFSVSAASPGGLGAVMRQPSAFSTASGSTSFSGAGGLTGGSAGGFGDAGEEEEQGTNPRVTLPCRFITCDRTVCRACVLRNRGTFGGGAGPASSSAGCGPWRQSTHSVLSLAIDPMMSVRSDISVRSLLQRYFGSEEISHYRCDNPRCDGRIPGARGAAAFDGNAVKQVRISRCPEVVLLQVKRQNFFASARYAGALKDGRRVRFGLTLDLGEFLYRGEGPPTQQARTPSSGSLLSPLGAVSRATSTASVASTPGQPGAGAAGSSLLGPEASAACTAYDLMSVVEHLGGPAGGHYVTYRRVPLPLLDPADARPQWVRCSDASVVQASEDQVLTCEAYLLCYVRRDSRRGAEALRNAAAAGGATALAGPAGAPGVRGGAPAASTAALASAAEAAGLRAGSAVYALGGSASIARRLRDIEELLLRPAGLGLGSISGLGAASSSSSSSSEPCFALAALFPKLHAAARVLAGVGSSSTAAGRSGERFGVTASNAVAVWHCAFLLPPYFATGALLIAAAEAEVAAAEGSPLPALAPPADRSSASAASRADGAALSFAVEDASTAGAPSPAGCIAALAVNHKHGLLPERLLRAMIAWAGAAAAATAGADVAAPSPSRQAAILQRFAGVLQGVAPGAGGAQLQLHPVWYPCE